MKQYFRSGEIVETGIGELKIEKEIGKGKSGFSFLAEYDKKNVVLKVMHNEAVPYYTFSKNKVSMESNAYELLAALEIPVPKLMYSNIEGKYLIKEYIKGKTGSEWIVSHGQEDWVIEQLFDISRKLEKNKINIDYFPSNFVIAPNRLYYIDYEVNNFDPKWNLLNWGIFYWANREGFKKFMQEGDATAINIDVAKGQPHREPFKDIVDDWIRKYL